MSFYEFLIELGIPKQNANNACIMVENDLPLDDTLDSLYWVWFNKEFIKE